MSNVYSLNDYEQQQKQQQNSISTRTMARNSNISSQYRPQSTGIRSTNNVSFMSDGSKTESKTVATESMNNSSSSQLKKVDNPNKYMKRIIKNIFSYLIIYHRT